MIRRTMIVGLLVLVVALGACGGDQADSATTASEATMPAQAAGELALSPSMQLSLGTLMLEDTSLAVTQAQAQELLPLWQMIRSLQGSTTASQVEVDAVYEQIQAAMTPEQLAAIEDMSQEDMQALFEELGVGRQVESDSDDGTTTSSFTPPEGMMPPEGGEGGDIILDPEEVAALSTEGMGSGSEMASTGAVVELLETRAAEL